MPEKKNINKEKGFDEKRRGKPFEEISFLFSYLALSLSLPYSLSTIWYKNMSEKPFTFFHVFLLVLSITKSSHFLVSLFTLTLYSYIFPLTF